MSVPPTDTQIRRLSRVCRERLGHPRQLSAPEGYPDGLALCVIDVLHSTGVNHAAVRKVVARYRAHRAAEGGNPETDGAVALLGTFHDLGSADAWAREIGNRDRLPGPADAPTRAETVEAAATALSDIEIYSAADLREVTTYPDLLPTVRAAWTGVAGQGSGVTWHHLLMLAGVPEVTPDRTIVRFVAGALGLAPATVDPEFAGEALNRAAADLAVTPTVLDHAAWRWQRSR
jgi:hypothetical protein